MLNTQGLLTKRVLRAGGQTAAYRAKVLATGPISYWPLSEAAGAVAQCLVNPAQNGTHVGVTLGQPGIGDGNTCPYYDGVNDYTNIYTATLAGAFNGDEGTVALWLKMVNAGIWTDGVQRVAFRVRTDAPAYIMFSKEAAANTFRIDRFVGASLGINISTSSINWMHLAVTWSRTADELRVYYNGVQSGATVNGLNAWAGAATTTQWCIGASTTGGATPTNGWIGHCAIWNRALAGGEIAGLANV